MITCTECGRAMEERILPEHTEDLGGIVVTLVDAVREYRCPECGEVETEVPDLQGLVRAVALGRALYPYQLTGNDLRLMRRALDMNQKDFAREMGLTPETVNRWENAHAEPSKLAWKAIQDLARKRGLTDDVFRNADVLAEG